MKKKKIKNRTRRITTSCLKLDLEHLETLFRYGVKQICERMSDNKGQWNTHASVWDTILTAAVVTKLQKNLQTVCNHHNLNREETLYKCLQKACQNRRYSVYWDQLQELFTTKIGVCGC